MAETVEEYLARGGTIEELPCAPENLTLAFNRVIGDRSLRDAFDREGVFRIEEHQLHESSQNEN
jgi:hypothetical protein